jgi:hypothetical protein
LSRSIEHSVVDLRLYDWSFWTTLQLDRTSGVQQLNFGVRTGIDCMVHACQVSAQPYEQLIWSVHQPQFHRPERINSMIQLNNPFSSLLAC